MVGTPYMVVKGINDWLVGTPGKGRLWNRSAKRWTGARERPSFCCRAGAVGRCPLTCWHADWWWLRSSLLGLARRALSSFGHRAGVWSSMWQSTCCVLLSSILEMEVKAFDLYVRAVSVCTSLPLHSPSMDTTRAGLGSLGVAEVGGPGGLDQSSGAVRCSQQSDPSMSCTTLNYLLMTLP